MNWENHCWKKGLIESSSRPGWRMLMFCYEMIIIRGSTAPLLLVDKDNMIDHRSSELWFFFSLSDVSLHRSHKCINHRDTERSWWTVSWVRYHFFSAYIRFSHSFDLGSAKQQPFSSSWDGENVCLYFLFFRRSLLVLHSFLSLLQNLIVRQKDTPIISIASLFSGSLARHLPYRYKSTCLETFTKIAFSSIVPFFVPSSSFSRRRHLLDACTDIHINACVDLFPPLYFSLLIIWY